MAHQLAMRRAHAPQRASATWTTHPATPTVRCRVNLVVAQTQRFNDRMKTDAVRGLAVAMLLSAGLWAVIGAAIVTL